MSEISKKNNKKIIFYIVVIVIIIFSLLLFFLVSNNSDDINDGVGSGGISKEEFDEIQIGKTTNFELNSIIDSEDKWEDDEIYEKCVEKIEEESQDHKYTYVYKYYGEKGGYAIITLQADYSNGNYYNDVIVIKKENYNLK